MSGIAEWERAGAVSSYSGDLELAGAVDAIRLQLSEAMVRAEGQRLQFELGDIELELAVAMTQEARAEGGPKAG
jgi:Trypsin-co-occurring domain 2